MNDAELTRWARKVGRMSRENVEALRAETFRQRARAGRIMRECQACKDRRPGVGQCEICQEMRAQLAETEDMLYLTERRLDRIEHNKLRHSFADKHGRWPNDDDELYEWYGSLFQPQGHTQEDRKSFNTLLGDITIDL
jgi:hypothetical protein